jgi:hypothetical protein
MLPLWFEVADEVEARGCGTLTGGDIGRTRFASSDGGGAGSVTGDLR